MLAVRRADVTELDAPPRRAPHRRHACSGRTLSRSERARCGGSTGAGDRVLVATNGQRLGLLNGAPAVITAVGAHIYLMSMRTDDQRHVTVPASWAGTHREHP